MNYGVSWPWVQGTGHLHSDVEMGHGSVAPCPMCAVPAQLLAQLEIILGEVQGLEQGTGRKSLMR